MNAATDMPGILFHSLHRAHQKAVQAELNAAGLDDLGSPPMLFLIRHWSERGKLATQRELADALHIAPATVAVSLRSLERGGYVEKRADPEDQRCRRIAITAKGTQAVERCFTIFGVVDRRMFAGFTAEEQGQLEEYLCRMLRNLRGSGPVQVPEKEES